MKRHKKLRKRNIDVKEEDRKRWIKEVGNNPKNKKS